MGYEFRILGPLECWWGESRLPVVGTRQQRLVATLLLDTGQTVSCERLVDVLWGDNPPSTSRQQLFKVVSSLRRAWSAAGMADVESVIETDGPGYRLTIDPGTVDACVFQHRVRQAARLRQSGRTQEAAGRLRSALRLWRGPTLSGIGGRALEGAVARLEEQRLSVFEDCIGLELDLGRHQEVVAELGCLIADNPFRERLAELLMLALYRSGRQTEALEVYHRLRARMSEDLGVEPTKYLRTLHARMLRQDQSLSGPTVTVAATQPLSTRRPNQEAAGPSYLPMDLPNFTGRLAAIAALDRVLEDRGKTVVIATIAGTAGVGKSALAVHWAHRVRHLFPDGQLYVNLRGFDHGSPMASDEVLAQFLAVLGVPDETVPSDLDARAGLFRSTLAGKRILVVLDNAACAEQVLPLLPGSPGCLVLVTSRNALIRLVALNDATRVTLNTLSEDESVLLLERILGTARVQAEREEVRELARLCGNLPLALRIAAANLASRPHGDIAATVKLFAMGDRLAQLCVDGDERTAVRAAFDQSYRGLDQSSQRMLKAIGLILGPDVTTEAIAAALAVPVADAAHALTTLETGHLVEPYLPGRYRLHSMVRLYAAERAHRDDGVEECGAIVARLLEYYFATTCAAVGVLLPELAWVPRRTVSTAPLPVFNDTKAALDWLSEERPNLLAGVCWANEHGMNWLSERLVHSARGFFWARRYIHDWTVDIEQAPPLSAADGVPIFEELSDWVATIALCINMASGHESPDDLECAMDFLRRALDAAVRCGDQTTQAIALIPLTHHSIRLGRFDDAVAYSERAIENTGNTRSKSHWAGASADLGTSHRELGDLDLAERELVPALHAYRELNCDIGEVHCQLELGWLRVDQSQPTEAMELFRTAHAGAQELGDREMQSKALAGMGVANIGLRQFDQAADSSGRALALARDCGSVPGEIRALLASTGAHLCRAESEHAAVDAVEAVDLCAKSGLRMYEGQAHQLCATALMMQGKRQAALDSVTEAIAVHRQTRQRRRLAEDNALLAEIRRSEVPSSARYTIPGSRAGR